MNPRFKKDDVIKGMSKFKVLVLGINEFNPNYYDLDDGTLTYSANITYIDKEYELDQDYLNNKAFNKELGDVLK